MESILWKIQYYMNRWILLFVLGAFLGCILEAVFCRITAKKWMNRSTYIFWPLSSVWGGAFLLASMLYDWCKENSIGVLFLLGVVLGTIYEYFYSVILESVFGVRFWDYSNFRYHIKGRVNLLYSMGWGIAAVAWIRVLYPVIRFWMEGVSSSVILAAAVALGAELLLESVVMLAVLWRYAKRNSNCVSKNRILIWIDRYFSDSYMESLFPYILRKP